MTEVTCVERRFWMEELSCAVRRQGRWWRDAWWDCCSVDLPDCGLQGFESLDEMLKASVGVDVFLAS